MNDLSLLPRDEPVCRRCDDTGLVRFDCQGDKTCGRFRPHGPHTFVVACECRRMHRDSEAMERAS